MQCEYLIRIFKIVRKCESKTAQTAPNCLAPNCLGAELSVAELSFAELSVAELSVAELSCHPYPDLQGLQTR